jgi:hypothetical protein
VGTQNRVLGLCVETHKSGIVSKYAVNVNFMMNYIYLVHITLHITNQWYQLIPHNSNTDLIVGM